jgi:hypothetical protein
MSSFSVITFAPKPSVGTTYAYPYSTVNVNVSAHSLTEFKPKNAKSPGDAGADITQSDEAVV